MPKLEPLEIIVKGNHDTGRTTVSSFIKMALEENGFRFVKVEDTLPLPAGEKPAFMERFMRNRERPAVILGTLKGFPNPPALRLRQAKPAYANANRVMLAEDPES